MGAALPRFEALQAPPAWRTIAVISDLHLQAAERTTFEAWRHYMRACDASALFILGDLFELWFGDEEAAQPGFAADCAAVLAAAARLRPVFFMHGNRDFLVGPAMLQACGVTLLHDPVVLGFAGRRWLLSHGDALCLDDPAYVAFRAQVRDPAWQQAFLARPLAEREAIARDIRARSESRRQAGEHYGQVDSPSAQAWMEAADASVLVHGHTHQPADHVLAGGRWRVVLSDWDAAASPPRLQALELSAGGWRRMALAA